MKSNASAVWHGTGKEGTGKMTTNSGVLKDTPYSYTTRFVSGPGTNPEEMIAAAHASCFAMKLAFVFDGAGFPVDSLETNCEITLESGAITSSHLKLKAKIKNVTKDQFDKLVDEAGKNCPISKLLNTAITIDAILD
ncbi:MAG TPA: OsmC family peroxiredoxin [Bacteroidia bacterium]|jgi:osmotically inducible protein OsmC|nr:OsmC family peroxiredoxin [Bacteroidia bacterium]